jgi:hypothetical protein
MIYLYNSVGRNIYTKLDEVVEVDKSPFQIKERYEQLEKTVGDNFNLFSSTMRLKQSKKALKVIDKNEHYDQIKKQNERKHVKANSELVNNLSVKKPFLINPGQNNFLNAFKSAIMRSKLFYFLFIRRK